jgi:periplasmic protein TonB
MAITLIESRHARQWHAGEVGMSMTFHAGVIAFAALMAGQAVVQSEQRTAEAIHFAQLEPAKPPEPPPEATQQPPASGDAIAVPVLAKGFQVLVAPVNIPTDIPPVDLTKAVTDEADFSGRGVAGGVARGVEGGIVPANGSTATGQPYFEFQVERGIAQIPGGPAPHYPELLRQAGVEGEVLAQFVVDTGGRVEPGSFKVLRTTHELFAEAVEAVIPSMRFEPAEAGGHKVRMLAQQAFAFSLDR